MNKVTINFDGEVTEFELDENQKRIITTLAETEGWERHEVFVNLIRDWFKTFEKAEAYLRKLESEYLKQNPQELN